MKKLLRYLLRLTAGIAGLILLLVILLQTDWLRDRLAGLVLDRVNDRINGRIEVGEIRGTLYSSVALRDLRVILDQETILHVGKAEVEFDLLPLLRRHFQIHVVQVDSPVVHLRRMSDSTFNLAFALSDRDPLPDPADQEETEWVVDVSSFRLHGFQASLEGDPGFVLADGSLRGSLHYRKGELLVPVDSLSLSFLTPDLFLQECSFRFSMAREELVVRDLVAKTRENALRGDLRYSLTDETARFSVLTDEICAGEFIREIDRKIAARRPVISVEGSFANGSLSADLRLTEGRGSLEMAGTVGRIGADPVYDIRGTAGGFSIGEFLPPDLSLTRTVVSFRVRGEGIEPGSIRAEGSINLRNARWRDLEIAEARLSVDADDGDLAASFGVATGSGSFISQATVRDYTRGQKFRISGGISNVDLSRFTDRVADLSARFEGVGSLDSFRDPFAEIRISADSLRVDSIRIHRLAATVLLQGGTIVVDSLVAALEGLSLGASGMLDTSGSWRLSCDLQSEEPGRYLTMAGLDSIAGSVSASGAAFGHMAEFEFSAQVNASNLMVPKYLLGEMGLRLAGQASVDSTLMVTADTVRILWNEHLWENLGQFTAVIGANEVRINSAQLGSGSQMLEADGLLSTVSPADFSVAVTDLRIAPFLETLLGKKGDGLLNASVRLTGDFSNPSSVMSISMKDGMVEGLMVPRIDFDATVQDSVLDARIRLERGAGGLTGTTRLPLRLAASADFGFIDPDRPLEVHLETSTFNLAETVLQEQEGFTVRGFVDATLDVAGTARHPDVRGSVSLREGSLYEPRLGIDYSGVRFALAGDGRELKLTDFHARAGEGSLTGTGGIRINAGDSLVIRPDLRFTATRFDVLNGPAVFATIDGTCAVSADSVGRVLLDGEVTVSRSRIGVQHFREGRGNRDLNPPLLMIAAGRIDTTAQPPDSTDRIKLPPFTGTIDITIPRASWLRGPRLNMELRGELKVASTEKKTAIVGYLTIEQGTYEFYGRKFVLMSGRVDFDEEGTIDPVVFVEVEYTFETDGTENRLSIIVRGPASNPVIEFFHNRSPISEPDAISYIVFGRKADDLNYGQKSAVSDLGNALAMDLAANMINAQLSSTLGSAFGLDVVRISGEDNWNRAVLTAGKYITDDIFVAYERGLSQTGSSGVAYESARLEYYLFRFLYLQLLEATDKTSGVDLFLKFD